MAGTAPVIRYPWKRGPVSEKPITGPKAGDRYVVISSDCHGGAPMDTYRQYLDSTLVDDFDAWRKSFVVEFEDLKDTGSEEYQRNHVSAVRQKDLEGDGVVGEVIFPNTIPPFFSAHHALVGRPPADGEGFRRSWAGLKAHNRWLADFCAELPGRRAGVAQVWLTDLAMARTEIEHIKNAGLFGGILLPIPGDSSSEPPLHSPFYEPLWSVCEDLEVPINVHGGSGAPDFGGHASSLAVMITTASFYSQRPLAQMIVSGVFERHPRLKVAFTETGSNTWIPAMLANLDWYAGRVERVPNSHTAHWAGRTLKKLSMKPSEYFSRNCWHGASFMNRGECAHRHEEGVNRIMWGSDYPHYEGTFPYTRDALRWTFQGVDPAEVQMMLAGSAASIYGFDLEALATISARVGPTLADLAGPMDESEIPPGAWTEALETVPRPMLLDR
jgi:predicted TIM-barrel fold metal-dependent hydrolase